MVSTMFIEEINQVPTADDDTQPCLVVRDYAVLLTVESDNPYLNGKQTMTLMPATPVIAEMMFHEVITSYEDMAGGHPFEKIGDFKYKGVFSGEKITLELVIVS